jgi:hypothetical protein
MNARSEFTCKKCGTKRVVEFEPPVPGVRQFEPDFLLAHCVGDDAHPVPGRIVRAWEERQPDSAEGHEER